MGVVGKGVDETEQRGGDVDWVLDSSVGRTQSDV